MKYDFKHKNKQPENYDLKIFRCNIFSDILHNFFFKKK
jgi:hypothetical protein